MIDLFKRRKAQKIIEPSFNKSFAQCGEDLIIAHLLRLLHIEKPFFIDVGAHHPFILSNTYLMYLGGARGINIEPDSNLMQAFKDYRPEDINLNYGVKFDDRQSAILYVMNSPVLNTFDKAEAEKVVSFGTYKIDKEIEVGLKSLNDIAKEYCSNKSIDFLSIDIEGLDFTVIKQFDFSYVRPKIICIESLTYSENNTEEKQYELIKYLETADYMLYADTYLNSIFVDRSAWLSK